MRLVVQRVRRASVSVGGGAVASIGAGYLVLAGVGRHETSDGVAWLAQKVFHLRLFEDDHGLMNRSLSDAGGEVLVVPQFTLYADTRRGRRPS